MKVYFTETDFTSQKQILYLRNKFLSTSSPMVQFHIQRNLGSFYNRQFSQEIFKLKNSRYINIQWNLNDLVVTILSKEI